VRIVAESGEERGLCVNTADEVVIVVRAHPVAYSLLGRQTEKSTSASLD